MNESQKRLDEKRQLRIRLENISIVLLAVFSFFLFLLTFFPFSRISQSMQASFEMGRMVQRAFSIVLLSSAASCRAGRRAAGSGKHENRPCQQMHALFSADGKLVSPHGADVSVKENMCGKAWTRSDPDAPRERGDAYDL